MTTIRLDEKLSKREDHLLREASDLQAERDEATRLDDLAALSPRPYDPADEADQRAKSALLSQ